jgi:hypothetical protein
MRNGRVSRATTVVLPGRVSAMIIAKRSMLYVDPLFQFRVGAYERKGPSKAH